MELHHLVEGEGAPLLLIQGMSGTHVTWGDPFLDALHARDLQTIRYDHRGTGNSPRVHEPFTIAELADDAAALLDELGLDSAHVLGISMGGMVAQELALRHPQRIRTLALGCTYCGGPGSALSGEDVVQRLGEAMMSGDRERALEVAYEVNLSPRFREDASRYEVFHAMATTLPVAVNVIMLQMQAIAGHDTSARLHEIAAPTLVIHGTDDEMLPVRNGELIASLVPGARLEVLDGVGHMFWWEEPERSAELVAENVSAAVAARDGA
ncbi:MAG TPA: alpha/beta fold hydrolase [Solirubrobacteraceae bacterium]|nr:alpha/beta fold hydrolase [Solirubrobacteraceae bacterium]